MLKHTFMRFPESSISEMSDKALFVLGDVNRQVQVREGTHHHFSFLSKTFFFLYLGLQSTWTPPPNFLPPKERSMPTFQSPENLTNLLREGSKIVQSSTESGTIESLEETMSYRYLDVETDFEVFRPLFADVRGPPPPSVFNGNLHTYYKYFIVILYV